MTIRKTKTMTGSAKETGGTLPTEGTQTIPPAHQVRDLVAHSCKAEPGGKAGAASKRDLLIRMLSTKNGAELAAISAKFAWLPHTTRAALSGLRKAGHAVITEKRANGKLTRYRIVVSARAPSPDDPAPQATEPLAPETPSERGSRVGAPQTADPASGIADGTPDPGAGAA